MGLFAIGTSCLAEVWVIGRRRVPAPPDKMSPFTATDATARSISHHHGSAQAFEVDDGDVVATFVGDRIVGMDLE